MGSFEDAKLSARNKASKWANHALESCSLCDFARIPSINFSLFLTVLKVEWTCQERTSRLNVESFRPLMHCNACSFSNFMLKKNLKSGPCKTPCALKIDFLSSLLCLTYLRTSLFSESSIFLAQLLCTVFLDHSPFSHNLVPFFFLFSISTHSTKIALNVLLINF